MTSIEMQERLVQLELELMRSDWIEIGSASTQQEFSREGIRRIVELARLYYLKNPLIKRGVRVQTYYVFGRGVNIDAKDEKINECIQAFLDDPSNQREFSGAQARKERDRELTIDGNLFFVFFTDKITGKVRIGTLPVDEIEEIIKARNNRKRNMWYKRVWYKTEINKENGTSSSTRMERYYRDHLNYDTTAMLGDTEVDQDACIFHVKVGSFADWSFGISETYAAQAWANAYKDFLTNFASVVASLAQFAWKRKVSGGASGVRAAKLKHASTRSASTSETNPARASGSVSIEGSSEDTLDPIKTANATTPAEQGKPLKLMVASAFGLPDTFFGDTDTGNLATAQSLDRPTEFQFVDRQELWVGIYRTILDFVVFQAVVASEGMLTSIATPATNSYGEQVIIYNQGINPAIQVDFPSILERETGSYLAALLSGAAFIKENGTNTLESVRLFARQILITLGFQDVDELLDQLFPLDNPEQA